MISRIYTISERAVSVWKIDWNRIDFKIIMISVWPIDTVKQSSSSIIRARTLMGLSIFSTKINMRKQDLSDPKTQTSLPFKIPVSPCVAFVNGMSWQLWHNATEFVYSVSQSLLQIGYFSHILMKPSVVRLSFKLFQKPNSSWKQMMA